MEVRDLVAVLLKGFNTVLLHPFWVWNKSIKSGKFSKKTIVQTNSPTRETRKKQCYKEFWSLACQYGDCEQGNPLLLPYNLCTRPRGSHTTLTMSFLGNRCTWVHYPLSSLLFHHLLFHHLLDILGGGGCRFAHLTDHFLNIRALKARSQMIWVSQKAPKRKTAMYLV